MKNIQGNRQSGKERGSAGLYPRMFHSYPSRFRLKGTDIGNLKVVMDYFVTLRNKGKIDDKVFSALTTKLCADFIENEMTAVLNKVLLDAFR